MTAAVSAGAVGALRGAGEVRTAEQRPSGALRAAAPADAPNAAPVAPAGEGAASGQRPRVEWRRSRAVGLPHAGGLERGVKLPGAGRAYFTWDPIHKSSPNRGWRRWGTDRLVRTSLRVVREFAAAHPGAPRIGIGDLSRPHGGDFGPRYGLPGHSSHQNGLDVDVYYPRVDQRERPPRTAEQVDDRLAQELVDRFVRAGAKKVLIGPNTELDGPAGVVVPYPNHDNHLHVRLPG